MLISGGGGANQVLLAVLLLHRLVVVRLVPEVVEWSSTGQMLIQCKSLQKASTIHNIESCALAKLECPQNKTLVKRNIGQLRVGMRRTTRRKNGTGAEAVPRPGLPQIKVNSRYPPPGA